MALRFLKGKVVLKFRRVKEGNPCYSSSCIKKTPLFCYHGFLKASKLFKSLYSEECCYFFPLLSLTLVKFSITAGIPYISG